MYAIRYYARIPEAQAPQFVLQSAPPGPNGWRIQNVIVMCILTNLANPWTDLTTLPP